jgi:REP element-mobilizing transposase RayT
MVPNALGELVQACWADLPKHYPYIECGAFVVMPNHVHLIVLLFEAQQAGLERADLERERAGFKPALSLSSV